MSLESLTPDRSVIWRRQRLLGGLKGNLYIAPEAPPQSLAWVSGNESPANITSLAKGNHASAYRFSHGGAEFVLKESLRPPQNNRETWERMCGISALKLNVALCQGLKNIGDDAVLPTGARLTTPEYHAMYAGRTEARMVMSFEAGGQPLPGDETVVSTRKERHVIFNKAVESVGIDPTTMEGYDDHTRNLLVRDTETGPEVVFFDAANVKVTQFAPADLLY
jgi:hypothetical protein